MVVTISTITSAVVRNVPAGYPTIQSAINAAENGDVIIVSSGTYYENINFKGKKIVLRGTDLNDLAIVAATVIDANGSGSVVTFANGESSQAKITGFTITGGYGTFNDSLGEDLYWGGGIYCSGASPTIEGNVITGNNGPADMVDGELVNAGYGGAIGCIQASPTITRNIIRGNSALACGGIITVFEEPKITNNLIYDNSALTVGGVAMLYGGELINNTIAANSALTAGNLYIASDIQVGQSFISNNIICNAKDGGGIYSEGTGIIQYNNVWNNTGGNYIGSGDLTGYKGNISADPLFVEPNSNEYHLKPYSPCINAGDPDFVPEPGQTDIDNEPRVFSTHVDIGADEYYGNIRPIADAGPDQSMSSLPALVGLDGSGSWDPDGDALNYHWNQIDGPSVELNETSISQPVFEPSQFGIYVFELVVDDGFLNSDSDIVGIVVGNNHAPVADAGAVRYAGPEIVLDGTGSYDPDGYGELHYQWRQISGPQAVITDSNTATPVVSFVQTKDFQDFEFELAVNDGDLGSTDTAVVIVVPAFGSNTLYQSNPPFDSDKPTILAFSGGNCDTGSGMNFGGPWAEKANWITVTSYGKPYYRYGDMLVVYLSGVASDYEQPIQTIGFSTGNMPALDVAKYVNTTYADPRYAVNRVSLLDTACSYNYSAGITQFLNSAVDGEQCWIDNYFATYGSYRTGTLNIRFPAPADHGTPVSWYLLSAYASFWPEGDMYNNGITAGYYYSVIGPGKNLQLAADPSPYYFRWVDSEPDYLTFNKESSYPGRLPEAVTLIGPQDATVMDTNAVVLSCEESRNSVGYQLLFGNNRYRVMDYNIVLDTTNPPNEVIDHLPFKETYWTVRAYDAYGSTIHTDPRLIRVIPVADAGPNQVVYSRYNGIAEVTLDGSCSYAAYDECQLFYNWHWAIDGNNCEANGVSPCITLPVGEHQIELIVNDGIDESQPDYCTITVIRPLRIGLWLQPSTINCDAGPQQVTTMMFLPKNVGPGDVNNQPLIMYPCDIQSKYQRVYGSGHGRVTRTVVVAIFDKNEICDCLGTGLHQVKVVGRLRSGRCYYGTNIIRIIKPHPYHRFFRRFCPRW
jgi:hypothetical protein